MVRWFSRIMVAVRKPIVQAVAKPTPLTYIGAGRLRETAALLRTAARRKVLVMTTPGMMRRGQLDEMLAEIRAAGIQTAVFDRVSPDPTFGIVEEAKACAGGCDAIVAVGGGSVLDAAKAVAASVTDGGPAGRLAGNLKVRRDPLMLIAVPTTAGTGSETTIAAVISDTVTHAKRQLLDPKLVPFAAILDPELTVGLPQSNTVQTAMDALTHALEAYVSTYATAQTDRYAEMAVRILYEELPRVLENPKDLKAREQLLIASFLAGMAFTRAYVGYVHAYAHAIGGRFGVPHGLANAVLLPHVMEYYQPVCQKRFARLAELCGVSDDAEEAARAEAFLRSLYERNEAFGVPRRLEQFPAGAIEDVITAAFRECHGVYPVPRYYSRAAARALLERICAGPDEQTRQNARTEGDSEK